MTTHDSISTRESLARMLANGLRGPLTITCDHGPTTVAIRPNENADSLLEALAAQRQATFPDCRHPVADRPADRP